MGKNTSTSVQELPEEFRKYYKYLFAEGRDAAERVNTEPYDQRRLAEYNPALQAAERGYAGLGHRFQGVGNQLIDQGQSTLRGDYLMAGANPYLQSHIAEATRPIQEQLVQQTLPQIGSAAQQAGAYGGARQGLLEGSAFGNSAQAMGTVGTNMAAQNYQQERQNQLNAGQLINQGTQMNMLSPAMLQISGGMQQENRQNVLNTRMQVFEDSITSPFRGLNQLAPLMHGSNVGMNSTFDKGGMSKGMSAGMGAVSGAASGAAFGGGWGAIPGAILGGAAGYFGSGQ